MQAEQEIAAPAPLARIEFVSPWQMPLSGSFARRWLTALADAWREGLELYRRAAAVRGHTGWWL
jgi:hypothetical protein